MLDVVHMELPMDGRAWRVEWIGDVRLNPSSPQELEVKVAFRRMGVAPDFKPTTKIREVWIGVGALCGLPLGSLWKDGRYFGLAPAEALSFTVNLPSEEKGADSVSYELATASLKNRKHYFGSHLIPEYLGNGYVMRIQLAKPKTRLRRLYIPLFEIARSWFLRDSELTLRLLSGPIDIAIEQLHDSALSKAADDGGIVLALRAGLSPGVVPTVAMLVSDPYSRFVAGRMVNQLVKAHVGKKTAGLEALPPVQGRWQIEAMGEWGEKLNRNAFYVYRMTAIQLPALPDIEWFHVGREDLGDSLVVSDGFGATSAQTERNRKVQVRVSHHLDPSKKMGRTQQWVDPSPFLNAPRVHKRPEDAPDLRNRQQAPSNASANRDYEVLASSGMGAGYGEGLPSFRYKSIPYGLEEQGSRTLMPAGLEKMLSILEQLQKDPDLKIRVVGGVGAIKEPSGIVRTRLPQRYAWSHVEGRPREALCYEIKIREHYFYLLEVERRFEKEELSTCLVSRTGGRRLVPSNLDHILDEFSQKRGSWKLVRKPYWRRTLAHKFKDERSFVRRVKKIMMLQVTALNLL